MILDSDLILIHSDEVDLKRLPLDIESIPTWLHRLIHKYEKKVGDLNYVICSDEKLLEMNKNFLHHDYYTDILSFDMSEEENVISGDIFISIDRLEENAREHSVDLKEEVLRVMAHGVLHFIGFLDGTEPEKAEMRKVENEAIALYSEGIH